MLARGEEADVRPAFHGHLQVDARGGDVDQIPGVIERQVGLMLVFEIVEFFLVRTLHPARGVDVDHLKAAIHVVFRL